MKLPVHGDVTNERDWLYVDDHAEALVRATSAIGPRQPRSNIDVVRAICSITDELRSDPASPRERLIHFVTDRPGHDFRYEIDPSRAEAALDWRAPHDFERGLRRTIERYVANEDRWQGICKRRYSGQRLGAAA